MTTQHLTASDLMVGDWMQFPHGIDKIVELPYIAGKGICASFAASATLFSIEIDKLRPILITPEILEKNGIKLLEVGDNGVATPARDRNRFEKWEIHTQWKDTYLWYDRQAKYWHLHNMSAAKLYYVHEFQRALRLCRIDKEITL